MTRFEFDPAARLELDSAAGEYEADYPGRGLRFYTAVEVALERLEETPNLGHLFPGIPEHFGVRRLMIKHFPYLVAYRILDDRIRVDAVIHTGRHPGYWIDRLR